MRPVLPMAAGAVLIAAPGLLAAEAGQLSAPWALAGGVLVALGLGAIRLSRRKWLSAPFLMLLLCTGGMAVGLAIDRQLVGAETLAGLCLNAPSTFLANLLRHWDVLRATHIAMLVGGAVTIPVVEMRSRANPAARCGKAVCGRAAFNLMCNAAMLIGMLTGSWFGPSLALGLGIGWGMPAMTTMMVAGMVWGMAASMTAYRLGFALKDRRHGHLAGTAALTGSTSHFLFRRP